MKVWIIGVVAVVVLSIPHVVRAEGARESGFAVPPPSPYESENPRPREPPFADAYSPEREAHRSPVRLVLGPAVVTGGRGLSWGPLAGLDFGRDAIGFRLSAAWTRGESGDNRPTFERLALYTGELTLDLNKRGAFHPVFGAGLGMANLRTSLGSGSAGIVTGRIGVEYATGLADADARIGIAASGAFVGPGDDEVSQVRSFGFVSATLAIGF